MLTNGWIQIIIEQCLIISHDEVVRLPRKPRQPGSEEVRDRILHIARRIISEEGIDALSIRKITKEMEYSPGIVYHYFKNKEQLLSCILQEGCRRILASVKPLDSDLPPDEAIRLSFTRYIKSALQQPAEYRAIMFSSQPRILEFTSVLGEGVCEKRPALMRLVSALESGVATGLFTPCDTQLTAQALWSAMFGLLSRLIVEQDVPVEQTDKLIQCQIELLLKGLRI